MTRTLLLITLLLGGLLAAAPAELPQLLNEDFEDGAEGWQPTDPKAWTVKEVDGDAAYCLINRRSKYDPPHRSPYNMSIYQDATVGSFTLKAKVQSTIPDYNHRDLCLFFGYQDPAHFYYVHLGKKTDDHANQIFIVNEKPRTKISTKTSPGTDWDDAWHDVKIVRDVESGLIQVFYDDMETPVMEATDRTFTWGKVGIGSFDDTGNFDEIRLWGEAVEPKK